MIFVIGHTYARTYVLIIYRMTRGGALIIGSADISAPDMLIFTVSGIGTINQDKLVQVLIYRLLK